MEMKYFDFIDDLVKWVRHQVVEKGRSFLYNYFY